MVEGRANHNHLRIALSWPEQEKEGAIGFTKYIFDWVSSSKKILPLIRSTNLPGFLFILWRFIFQFLFILSFPFYILYTLTIPPCDTEETRKWYLLSFTMAIGWIVAISFGMILCVETMGEVLHINHFTMGLVIIAVGTSIPGKGLSKLCMQLKIVQLKKMELYSSPKRCYFISFSCKRRVW